MTSLAFTDSAWPLRPSQRLAHAIAPHLPALLLLVSMVVTPLLIPSEGYTITSDYLPVAGGDAGNLLTRLPFLALAVLGAGIVLLLRPRLTRQEVLLSGALALYLLYIVLSTFWSLSPSTTLNKALYQIAICATLWAGAVCSRDPERILGSLFLVMAVVVALNLFSVVSRPPGLIGHEGIYGEKNTLGGNASIALFFGLFGAGRGRLSSRLLGVFTATGAIVILLASDSKTALGLAALAPVVGIAMLLLARIAAVPPLVSLLFALVLGAAIYMFAAALLGFSHADLLAAVFGDETLTGRTYIWSFVLEHIEEHPWLGWGYQGFWQIGIDSPRLLAERQFIAKMPYAHNGFLDVLLETGAIGLSLFGLIFMLVFSFARRFAALPGGAGLLCLTLLAFALGRNMLESNWFTGAATVSVLFVLLGLMAAGPLPQSSGANR